MERVRKFSKKKIIITVIVGILLFSAAGGYSYKLYAQDLQNKVQTTQAAYHSIKLPATLEKYSAEEKIEFDNIMNEREIAFKAMDISVLETIQNKLDALGEKVSDRIEAERITKLYADKKSEIESVNIAEGANEEETNIFNGRKTEVLQMVTDKVAMEVIDAKVVELKQTNTDIETRKSNDATAAANTASSGEVYSDTTIYDDDVDYPSSPSKPGGGGANPAPTVPTPAEPSPEPETCRTRPDGRQLCTGGDW